MPTIMIETRPDRNDRTVTVRVTANGVEQALTMDRAKQYVVAEEVLGVLQHSHEAPFLHVLDRHSQEPSPRQLPTVSLEPPEETAISAMVKTFGKKADTAR